MRVVLVDPSPVHYYQPGWSMVGGGAFEQKATQRDMKDVIPRRCEWVQGSVKNIVADENHVLLNNDMKIYYKQLVVAPGLRIDWSAIEGLEETLGKNGVTSNYRYDLAPYTWQLVNEFKGGKAIFTQPPMPIKCAGAPQKAMYLSCSAWKRNGVLNKADVHFCNAGGVLFGVKEYVPALMEYVDDYGIKLDFQRTLVKVNGALKTAWFKDAEGKLHETVFDFLHVVPPQVAPDFVKESGLSDDNGWLDVDKHTLRSTKYSNVWGVGDIVNAPNAKTMAAARKQAPVVAQNIFNTMEEKDDRVSYDGYGSCPLMVEHGKIVLAEFRYGGKLSPTFPSWINRGTKATKLAWFLKQKMLPVIYWHGMLKGREFLTETEQTDD